MHCHLMKILHTADWHIDKPFAKVEDTGKRERLRRARLESVHRIGELAREHDAELVLVAGDLFDSPTVGAPAMLEALSMIGSMGVTVVAIPGNHDHGGTGSVWSKANFREQCTQLAPNFQVLLESEPVVVGGAVILPCPLAQRHVVVDPTGWLRNVDWAAGAAEGLPVDAPRIVLAHGSVQDFSAGSEQSDEEEWLRAVPNQIDLNQMPMAHVDYVALGDWHGMKQVAAKAWYSGTPEPDRFARGEAYQAGHVLVAEVGRGRAPRVVQVATGRIGWERMEFVFQGDSDLDVLNEELRGRFGARVGLDLLELSLEGTIGLEASARLDEVLQNWRDRLIRLKVRESHAVIPGEEEMAAMLEDPGAPLITRVARELRERVEQGGEQEREVALAALRVLVAEKRVAMQEER